MITTVSVFLTQLHINMPGKYKKLLLKNNKQTHLTFPRKKKERGTVNVIAVMFK